MKQRGCSCQGTVYLLHFDRPYRHARHYIGWCRCGRLEARLAEHRSGRGARLMEVIAAAGIGFTLARTWPGTRELERRLKNWHHASRACPLCGVTPRPVKPPNADLPPRTGPSPDGPPPTNLHFGYSP